jgi:sarcosine oxidase
MSTYDVIIAGAGAMGAQTCWQLARRGQRVLALDRYDVPNAMGSSHGVNRIIRLAYFEHPSYVPILRRAYQLWRELEQTAGEQLLYVTGSLDIGEEGSAVIAGSLASCREHHLDHTLLDARETNRRFPGYRLPDGFFGVYQPDGGFVLSERAIVHASRLALEAGATIRAREPMLDIAAIPGGGVRVRTPAGTYEAGRLVVATGAWIGALVPHLRTIAVPERQALGWFRPRKPDLFQLGVFPVSNLKSDVGHFYQFPMFDIPGFKIGLYHHLRETGDADALEREPNATDLAALRRGLSAFFPEADGDLLALRTCFFTNTPDEHFILDALPGVPEVVVASPCSGHGYKFASAIGEILADMAMDRTPPFDLSMFKLSRFAASLKSP